MSAQPVVVLVECEADGITLVSREALTFARGIAGRLADPPVHAVAVGPLPADEERVRDQLAGLGVAALHHA
ncbi:MAG: hypothetical protein ACRDO0_20065, partial [Nocardioidaceae bacterium]